MDNVSFLFRGRRTYGSAWPEKSPGAETWEKPELVLEGAAVFVAQSQFTSVL